MYPANTVFELRGNSWKERANALRVMGRFNEALDSLSHAERAYRRLRHPELGLGAVAYVRAFVRWEQERYDDALALTRDAARAFAHLGQTDLYVATRHLEAMIHFECRSFTVARSIFEQVRAHGEATDDVLWLARAAQALGNCALELDDTATASHEFHVAKTLFTELGTTAEVLRTEWGIARVVLALGKRTDGVRRLASARDGMATLHMVTDAALATLDLIEVFHTANDLREVQSQAHSLVETFIEAGMLTGALTAAAYLRDSAVGGEVTPILIDHVRTFFRRSERQPDLLFTPP